jgi:hypothetical protein
MQFCSQPDLHCDPKTGEARNCPPGFCQPNYYNNKEEPCRRLVKVGVEGDAGAFDPNVLLNNISMYVRARGGHAGEELSCTSFQVRPWRAYSLCNLLGAAIKCSKQRSLLIIDHAPSAGRCRCQ